MRLRTKASIGSISILIALATVLSYVETLICTFIPMKIPGVRLGITNLVTMFSYRYFGKRVSIIVVVARCLISFMIIGSPWSLLLSLSGAFVSFVAIAVTNSGYNSFCSPIGSSVLSAACHVTGQIVCASVFCGYPLFFSYLPILLLSSTVTGTINGCVLNVLYNRTDILRN